MPKTKATIKKTIRQKRDLISPFPKTIAANSAKGLWMDKIPRPPRDTLMMKTRLSLLQTEDLTGGYKNWNSVADTSGSYKQPCYITYSAKLLPKLICPPQYLSYPQ